MQLDLQQELDPYIQQAKMQAKKWDLTLPQFVLVAVIGSILINAVTLPEFEKILGTKQRRKR